MPKRIHVAEYDPAWASAFESEAARIRSVCPVGIVAIEHMGSTSVPGLPAKPVIDMVILVPDFESGEVLVEPIRSLGYTYKGVNGIPGRRYFDLPGATPTELDRFHIHMYPVGHEDARRVLRFRDFLRANPAAVDAYAAQKRKLAARYPEDILLYTGGKTSVIRQLYRAMDGLTPVPISVEPYQDEWARDFDRAAERLNSAAGEGFLAIEHIGSTSVAGLAAKPIIDIMPVVRDFDVARELVPRLEEAGYWYCGENDIPRRHYFVYEVDRQITEHVHVLEDSSVEARKHRMFRDHLRANAGARDEYAALKRQLAADNPDDREAYTDAKTELIFRILKEAGWEGEIPTASPRP